MKAHGGAVDDYCPPRATTGFITPAETRTSGANAGGVGATKLEEWVWFFPDVMNVQFPSAEAVPLTAAPWELPDEPGAKPQGIKSSGEKSFH